MTLDLFHALLALVAVLLPLLLVWGLLGWDQKKKPPTKPPRT